MMPQTPKISLSSPAMPEEKKVIKKPKIAAAVLAARVAKSPIATPVVHSHEEVQQMDDFPDVLVNRGTGAGGANTNKSGKTFEQKTENESRLLAAGFIKKPIVEKNKAKFNYFLERIISPTSSIVYLTQGALKLYFKSVFSIEMHRCPDEAYLFRQDNKYLLKILEKKNQNVAGSVDTKLMAGNGFIRDYKKCLRDVDGKTFDVQYAFCISDFLKQDYVSDCQKFRNLREILEEDGIAVLFGDDEDYYQQLDAWIGL
jgi:hypothetical protein